MEITINNETVKVSDWMADVIVKIAEKENKSITETVTMLFREVLEEMREKEKTGEK